MKIKNCLWLHFTYNSYQETYSTPAHMIGVAQQYGFNIKDLFIVKKDITLDSIQIIKKIKQHSIDTIFVSLLFLQEYYAKNVLSTIKKTIPNIQIIVGGLSPTVYTDWFLTEDWWDILCYGEGEETLEKLSKDCSIEAIPNIIWRKDNELIKNHESFLQEYESIAYPSYNYQYVKDRTIYLTANKGCYNKCSFCSHDYFREKEKNVITTPYKKIKTRNINDLIEYLKFLKTLEIKNLKFTDALFFVDNEWFNEFHREYIKNKDMCCKIVSGTSYPSFITEKLVNKMKDFDIEYTTMELQSLSFDYRKNVYKRYHSDEKILESSELLNRANINILTSLIVGGPEEDIGYIYDNFDLILKMKPKYFTWNVFQPFPNMQLYKYMVEKDYIDFSKQMKIGEKPNKEDLNQSYCSYTTILKNQSFTQKDIDNLYIFIESKMKENNFSESNGRGLYIKNE